MILFLMILVQSIESIDDILFSVLLCAGPNSTIIIGKIISKIHFTPLKVLVFSA